MLSCLLQGIRFRLQLVRTEHMGWGILSWYADSCLMPLGSRPLLPAVVLPLIHINVLLHQTSMRMSDSNWVCRRDTIPSGAYVCHYYSKVRIPVCLIPCSCTSANTTLPDVMGQPPVRTAACWTLLAVLPWVTPCNPRSHATPAGTKRSGPSTPSTQAVSDALSITAVRRTCSSR